MDLPGGLEESAIVLAGVDWLAISIVDDKILNAADKALHIVTEPGHSWHECCLISTSFHCLIGGFVELARSPALQLPAPYAAKVEIALEWSRLAGMSINVRDCSLDRRHPQTLPGLCCSCPRLRRALVQRVLLACRIQRLRFGRRHRGL